MHGSMSLSQRVENALSGFLLWDLWSLVGRQREIEQKVGRGRMQIAPVTRKNLQSIALTTSLICAGKPEAWDVFRQPHGLNEIHIERFFGQLRGQCASSEMSARAYRNAGARLVRKLEKAKSAKHSRQRHPLVEAPLSTTETFGQD